MFELAGVQRIIFSEIRDTIVALSANGDWAAFALVLPMGVVFGAVHALMPGHGKAMLGTYLVGSAAGIGRAILVAFALSATHVLSALFIALFSVPIISSLPWSFGRAPVLEMLSCGLLAALGCWMGFCAVWRRRDEEHGARHMIAGLSAGLIPCPLTLFTVTFCVSRGVPAAGVMFAVTMLTGILFTLSAVAAVSVLGRTVLLRAVSAHPSAVTLGRSLLEALSGGLLILLSIMLYP